MNGGAWWATVHGVAKSWTRLSEIYYNMPQYKIKSLIKKEGFLKEGILSLS